MRFQSTLSLRRATPGPDCGYHHNRYFNPRSPCGERLGSEDFDAGSESLFQSTLSLRRATPCSKSKRKGQSNFNPRSPCGERPWSALRCAATTGFQSTLSLRRATDAGEIKAAYEADFNPRSPCGERQFPYTNYIHYCNFNPRSPCGERPRPLPLHLNLHTIFQSTLSLRRATSGLGRPSEDPTISIHALLAESDRGLYISWRDFARFQSTLSLRRATFYSGGYKS